MEADRLSALRFSTSTHTGEEVPRAAVAVLLGCFAVLVTLDGGIAAGAVVVLVAATYETILVWPAQSWLRSVALFALPLVALGIIGPTTGRPEMILVMASVSLWHLLLVGSGMPRRRPTHRAGGVAISVVISAAWIVSGSGLVAFVSVLAVVIVSQCLRRTPVQLVEPIDPQPGSRFQERVASAQARLATVSAPRPPAWLPARLDPVIGGCLVGLASAPMFYSLAANRSTSIPRIAGWFNDFPKHLEVVDRLGLDPVVVPPHPVFHILTRLGRVVLPATVAATIVMSLCVLVAFVGLHRLARRPTGDLPGMGRGASLIFASVVLIGESPAALLAYTHIVPPMSNFASFHVWNSPTETVSIAATVLLLPTLLDAIEDRRPLERSAVWRRLAFLAAFATVAKPAFTVVLLVALPLYQFVTGRWRDENRRLLMTRFAVPVVLVLFVQSVSMILFAPEEFRTGLTFDPLVVVGEFRIGGSGPVYFLGAGVVLLAVWARGRGYLKDTGVGLSWVALAVSLLPLVFLRETGSLAGDGNVAKLSAVCWFVVIATSSRLIAGEVVAFTSGSRSRVRRTGFGWLTVTAAYAAAAVASGSIVWHVLVNG